MGMVPYLIGSGMMIAIFNAATKYFKPSEQRFANQVGRKMALGVIFYAALKTLSKKFIELPIYLKTGVDINKPYKFTCEMLKARTECAMHILSEQKQDEGEEK